MTAVEWLVEQTKKQEWFTIEQENFIEQAKTMEKEQIIEACDYGKECLFKGKYLQSEQYYNQTFGGNNEQQ